MSIISIIGVLVYAIATSITGTRTNPDAQAAAYVAVLHFLIPLSIAYTISGNHPLSRPLIAVYIVILSVATLAGFGFLGELEIDDSRKTIGTAAVLAATFAWLFRSPKMRFYYALISTKPIPADLRDRAAELAGRTWLSPKKSATIEWVAEHLENVVLLGFIAVVIYALFSTGNT